MTEEKTLAQIEWEARMGVYQAAGYTPTDFSYHWDSLSDTQKAAQAAGAAAVREKVIEECAAFAEFHAKTASAAGKAHPEGSKNRDRCFARGREALMIAASLRARATSGDRTALHPDQRELETNLIHPHPRQDGQQCDHPIAEDA